MNEFYSAIDRFTEVQRGRGFVEFNIQSRRRHLISFVTCLVEVRRRLRLADLTQDDITQWKLQVAQRHSRWSGLLLRPLTTRGIHCSTRCFCAWLATEGIIPKSVVQSYQLPRVFPTYKSALRHHQVRKVLRAIPGDTAIDHMLRALAEVLYSTGARPSEVLRIKLGDIDFENRTVFLKGKGGKERVVPIGTQALRWVESYQQGVRPQFLRHPREQYLWLNQSGNRLTYGVYLFRWKKCLGRVPALAGVTAYAFRRACATELVRCGAEISLVQAQLSHRDARHLMHYVRTDLTDLKKALARYHPRDRGMDDETRL